MEGKREEVDFIFYFFLISFYFFFMILNAPLYNGWRLVYFLNIFNCFELIICLYLPNRIDQFIFIKLFLQ